MGMKVDFSVEKHHTPGRKLSGLGSHVSWERLKPHLEAAVALKDGEKIVGITVEDSGIQVWMEHQED